MPNGIERPEATELSSGEIETLYDSPSPEIESLDDMVLSDAVEDENPESVNEDTEAEVASPHEDLDAKPLEDGSDPVVENNSDTDDRYHAIPNSERLDYDETKPEPYRAIPNSERADVFEGDSSPESVEEALEPFEQDRWNELDTEEQKEAVEGLADNICDDLGIEDPPKIEYYNAGKNDCGAYDPRSNTLYINEANLSDSGETADTVAHELRHAYQHQCAENPDSSPDPEMARQYQESFDNYIRPEDDFEGYQDQLVEADALDYAQQIAGQIH